MLNRQYLRDHCHVVVVVVVGFMGTTSSLLRCLYQNSGVMEMEEDRGGDRMERSGEGFLKDTTYLQYKWMYISVSFYSAFIKRNHFTAGYERGTKGFGLIVETVILHVSELCQYIC